MRDHILQYRISYAFGHALYRQMSSRRKDHHAHIHLRVLLLQMQEKLHRSKMRVAQKEENAWKTRTPQDPQEVQEASEADETKQAVMISHQCCCDVIRYGLSALDQTARELRRI